MNQDEFENMLTQVKKPEVTPTAAYRQLKLTLMNTRKSAFWGTWLLVVPIFFLSCVVMKYLFHWQWGLGNTFIEMMGSLDKDASSRWITPVMFILLPAAGTVLNLLAIVHFAYERTGREVIISIRLKWLNLIIAAVSICFILIILLYAITENAHHAALQQYPQTQLHENKK